MPTDSISLIVRHNLERGRKVAITHLNEGVAILVTGVRAQAYILLCDYSCTGPYARVGSGRSLFQARRAAGCR